MEEIKDINTQLVNCIINLSCQIQRLSEKIDDKPRQILYTNKSLLALLQINTSTLKKYRDEGLLGFSKVGDKYYYTTDDVNKFLKNNHFEPFA